MNTLDSFPCSLSPSEPYPTLVGVTLHATIQRVEQLSLHMKTQTEFGDVECRFCDSEGGEDESGSAVLWVLGPAAGLYGPVEGLYERLKERLCIANIASMALSYRRPGHIGDSVTDVLTGIVYLRKRGRDRVILAGHGFGGAVVINAAVSCPDTVVAVAALGSQTYGTECVGRIAPRPLLLMHGSADEIVPVAGARDLFARASEPKELLLYPGCRHSFDPCRTALDDDLYTWLCSHLGMPGAD